ncbi:MAG: ATP-binding cassette domain-containing protein [Actinobacteria bacterium]|nr:ATP-binding cassette domain-containing protein [Actinomycetota bacterium]MBO0786246.1 ATP-binding cassette domain-containing protein [Actinomycetota bacterium]
MGGSGVMDARPRAAAAMARLGRGGTLRGPLGATGLVTVTGLIVMVFFAQQYAGSVFMLAFTYAIVTAGMAVQIGFSQQIAFSQSVFMGFGAYGVAVLNTRLAMPSALAALVVTVASGLVALLLGSVVTRASGLALAVATIMLPLIAVGYLSSASYLGGSVGMPLTGSLWPAFSPEATLVGNAVITVAVVAVVVFVATRILSSDIGLELYVLGADERTAAAMGVATPRRKLELFVLGSMFAALGGAVYAGSQLFVPATIVDPTAELSLLMMLFVGGRRSILGAVAGALLIQYVSGASSWVSINILVVEGVLITVVLLVDPEGLAGILTALYARLRGRPAGAVPGLLPGLAGVPGEPGAAEPEPALAEPVPGRPGAPASEPGRPAPDSAGGPAGAAAFTASWRARGNGAGGAAGMPLLECAGVGKEYGGLRVLDDVGLKLPARGLFGLCGPNGAGKTTLLGVIGGSVRPDGGRVLLDGADITRLPPQQRFHLGVSRTFQTVRLIGGRTVLDNVAVACLSSHRSSIVTGIARNRLAEARERAAEALDHLGMAALAGREVSSLTLETQRMVEFARAISARPRLLLLDEPASGLSEPQRERLAGVLRAAGEMTCVLLVEHDLGLVAEITQQIFVLASGQLVFGGSPAEFRASEVVQSLLIGL